MTVSDPSRIRAGELVSGWRDAWAPVLAGGVVMGLALGVRHVHGLFLLPVIAERGWSRETFGLAMAVQNLSWGLVQPFAGLLADRCGSAKVVVAGLACYALGLYGMAKAAAPAAFVWSAGVCLGIALAGTAFGVVYGALSRLVSPARRAWALGTAGAIGGIGQFAMVPAAQALIVGCGWQRALLALSLLMALLVPLARALREPAAAAEVVEHETGLSVTQALREACAHPGFWQLNLGFLACGFQLAFIATHLPAYLLDHGLPASVGVAALALVALTNIVGIYACGLAGGAYRRKHLLAGLYLARAGVMALFLLAPLSAASVYLFAAAMGLLWLGTVPLTNGLLAQIFGLRYIGTLFGLVFLGHQLGSFLGVWLGGYVFDATRSYDFVWGVAMALGLLSAALHWPIDDRELRRVPAPAA